MRAGESTGSAIARSANLAQHVEQLGYKRYWLAEHHSIPGLACSATPVLIGYVAAATKTIRVGSGGVMLPNHAPPSRQGKHFGKTYISGLRSMPRPGKSSRGCHRGRGGRRGQDRKSIRRSSDLLFRGQRKSLGRSEAISHLSFSFRYQRNAAHCLLCHTSSKQ